MFRELIQLDKPVLSFVLDKDFIYLLAENRIMKFDKRNLSLINNYELFKKKGLARSLMLDEHYLYCKDFGTFYFISKSTLKTECALQLGGDVSSDICGMTSDENNVYVCIRNGAMAVIDKSQMKVIEFRNISGSSIWEIVNTNDLLYAGSVEGHLLVIDKRTLTNRFVIESHKQNLNSILINKNYVITASQDKSVVIRDLDTLQVVSSLKNAHKKGFGLGGVWQDYLITVCFRCVEMKFWDWNGLDLVRTVFIPQALTGVTAIDGNTMYMSARMINGIASADLRSLLETS